jgi:hypothetical protein
MATDDIIQNMISRLGQSQDERLPPELGRHFVDIDERDGRTLLTQAAALAKLLRFYRRPTEIVPGGWQAFFPADDDAQALLDRDDGAVPPHLGLFASFLELYRNPQQAINAIAGRHLDFQYRRVLQFAPRPAEPDRAHLLLELKKGAAPTAVTPEHAFSAGKDAGGVELIYQPVREVVINRGQVASLRSVFRDTACLRFAPVANSSDGLGGELDQAQPKWRAFGDAALPPAQIGFAFASPVLRMQEGMRSIQLDLQLATLDPARHTAGALAGAFAAHLTGPKGWQGPYPISGSLTAGRLTLLVSVPPSEPAIVDYSADTHGHAFAAQSPMLQVLLKPDAALHYADLEGLTLSKARLQVEVDGLQALTLENDFGSLNPKKAFQPFGAQPVAGSRFMIGCDEALSKRLLDLNVKLTWQGAPANLYDWYANYRQQVRMKNGVTATLAYQDRSGQTTSASLDVMARGSDGVTTISPTAPPSVSPALADDAGLFALLSSGSVIGRALGGRFVLKRPIYQRLRVLAPDASAGFVTVTLGEDFLHADYRKETIANALAQNKIVLNEPYTPTVQAISLGYRAHSDEVDFSANDFASFTNLDLQFFHVGCFGQMREHAFLRNQLGYVADKRITLLPSYPNEGEFLVGISGVAAGDSLSLLVQVAQGSADPDLPPQQLSWSVLGDNYWRPLTTQELVLDTSNGLRTSGIVALSLPFETTTEHTFLPAGLVWLRATVLADSAAVCQLVNVANNAVEVRFADRGNDPTHLTSALAAGGIAKLKTPQAEIKTTAQPYASFGGRLQETDDMLTRRAAERLRHRNRCLTPWDYERIILEAFPDVHKVKCIPHASESSWQAAGHVLLVVVPDLRNRNAVDPLRPRVDIDVLSRMAEFVQQHCGIQVRVHVKNPRYQRVQVDFNVRFRAGKPFLFYSQQLNDALVRALSPWAFHAGGAIEFGGQVYRSVLLDLVEELPYVDFVTDFKLLSVDSAAPQQDFANVSADAPDAILVSSACHTIGEVKES